MTHDYRGPECGSVVSNVLHSIDPAETPPNVAQWRICLHDGPIRDVGYRADGSFAWYASDGVDVQRHGEWL